jgi:hypothetical protein
LAARSASTIWRMKLEVDILLNILGI